MIMEDSKEFVKYGESIVEGLAQGSKNVTEYTFTVGIGNLLKRLEEKTKQLKKGTN